jgi:predicted PurR-regulated permease PerM
MTVENTDPAVTTRVDIRSVALTLVAAAAVIILLQYMQAVLIPFVLAALLFYALDPAVDRMESWHLHRAIGAALMIAIVVASVFGLAYFLQDEAVSMVDRLPQAIQHARDELRRGRGDPPGVLEKVQAAAKELETFLQFGTLPMTAAIAGVALLITTVEGWVLTPALMGRVAQMNNVTVFAGLLFWSWMWGIPGMLLAVPMMMIIKAICDRVEDLQPIGRFLGE